MLHYLCTYLCGFFYSSTTVQVGYNAAATKYHKAMRNVAVCDGPNVHNTAAVPTIQAGIQFV